MPMESSWKRPAWKVILDKFLVSLKYQQLGHRMEGKWQTLKEKAALTYKATVTESHKAHIGNIHYQLIISGIRIMLFWGLPW